MEMGRRLQLLGRLRCRLLLSFRQDILCLDKAIEWTGREPEYVKRAGFVLMAALAVHDKKAPDGRFEAFLRSSSGTRR